MTDQDLKDTGRVLALMLIGAWAFASAVNVFVSAVRLGLSFQGVLLGLVVLVGFAVGGGFVLAVYRPLFGQGSAPATRVYGVSRSTHAANKPYRPRTVRS